MHPAPPTRQELVQLPGVHIGPDVDVGDLAARFETFQALTHGFVIDNPMSSEALDAVVDALDPRPGMRAVDVPCGRGELLLRLADRGVAGSGVDLSPWVVRDAHDRARSRGHQLTLHLGDGKGFPYPTDNDVACSLGGSWIWNGPVGTVRALAGMVKPGGRVAFGDVVLRPGADVTAVEGGVPLSRARLEAEAVACGLEPVAWFSSDIVEWERYVMESFAHIDAFTDDPERRAAYYAFAREGAAEFERERSSFEWVVLVAASGSPDTAGQGMTR